MRPESGRWMPQSSAKSVDLPAPFGPMMQLRVPSAISTVTFSAATTPPKRFDRPSVARIVAISALAEGGAPTARGKLAGERHHDALGEEQHHDDEQRADDDEGVLVARGGQREIDPVQRIGGERHGEEAVAAADGDPDDGERGLD